MTITELRNKRNELWNGAKAFLESHRDNNGNLSVEDDAAYTKMENEVNALGKEIARLERQADIDAELSKPVSAPLTSKPADTAKEEKKGRASKDYRFACLDALRSNFRRISNVMQVGVAEDGGYLVPEEWDSRLIDTLNEENIMRKLGTVIKTSGLHRINVVANKPAALWVEEGGELTFGDATFDQKVLDAFKLHVGVKVTEELLYDSMFDLEAYLINQFGMAIANTEEKAFMVGTGEGQPLGIFDENGGATVVDTLDSLKADNIIDLVYSLKRPYRKNAAFIMNDVTIASIRKFKDNNGAYMWQPAYAAGEPDTLMGYPLYTSAYAPEGAVAFGDFSYYNIGDRGDRSFAELRELFAGNGMIGFLAKERVDGKLLLAEAVQLIASNSDDGDTGNDEP